jgi:hypothetical protein
MIDIDKELEWVTAWDKEDRHVGVISNHECVVDVDWVEELLTEVKRLRMYEVAWKMLYHNAIEEGRETRTRTWKEIMELVRSDVKEMVDTEDALFDGWLKGTGGFE